MTAAKVSPAGAKVGQDIVPASCKDGMMARIVCVQAGMGLPRPQPSYIAFQWPIPDFGLLVLM